MKFICLIFLFLLQSCSSKKGLEAANNSKMIFTAKEILDKIDLAYEGLPCDDYPTGNPNDIKYNFYLDLEHGYCETAGSKIHLYGDDKRWAIVLEKRGYMNRGYRAEIELNYVGNCVDYPVEKYPEYSIISNSQNFTLISSEEYERISNKEGSNMEQFELISPTATEVIFHNKKIDIEHDLSKYLAAGIHSREYDNPKNLIGYADIVRYIAETNPKLISATEDEIRQHIPKDIPKLMTIDKFHFTSAYDEDTPPSSQELYHLIAKVLITGNTSYWKPTLQPNNHWSKWESGNL